MRTGEEARGRGDAETRADGVAVAGGESDLLAALEHLKEFHARLIDLSCFQEDAIERPSLELICHILLDKVQRLVQTRAVSVFLVQEESGLFELFLSRPAKMTKVCREEHQAQIEGGTFAWALKEGRPVLVETCRRKEGFDGVIFIPLLAWRRPIGMVEVLTDLREEELDQETIQLLSLLSRTSSLTIHSQRLQDDLARTCYELEEKVEERTGTLRQTLEELEVQSRMAQEASRLKSEFLANMSHELRTPLNAVIGFTELLLEDEEELNDLQRRNLNKVSRNAKHLLSLINDILDLSKIEAGRMSIHPEEVELLSTVELVTENLRPLAMKKGLGLEVDAPPDLPPLYIDGGRLKQILINLLSNAIKFTDEGGVTVSVRPNGDMFDLSVVDTGIGIAPEDQVKVFEEFRQVDGSVTRREGGTGLGMVIVKRFCELMGGKISLESEPGKGSTFTVTLPISYQHTGDNEDQGEDG